MGDEQAALGGDGLRVVPGITHQAHDAELVRHLARYRFARRLIAADVRNCRAGAAPLIIDLGCGAGYGAAELARVPGAQVIGLDCEPAAIEHARRHYAGEKVQFYTADLRALAAERFGELSDELSGRLKAAPPDYLVACEVLEHLPDGLELLARLRWKRLAVISTPYLEPAGRNPHHVRWDISEADYACFGHKAFFYQDLPGVIYAACDQPPQPINLLCVLYADSAGRALDAVNWWLDWQRAAHRAQRLLPDAWAAIKDLARPMVRPLLRRLLPRRYAP